MALRKAVVAEALDLPEAVLGEVGRIAAPGHAVDEAAAEGADVAGALEGRHRPAQPVGLRGREAGADDRDLPRLLLAQRHPDGLLQHPVPLGLELPNRLHPLPAAQCGRSPSPLLSPPPAPCSPT